MGPGAEERPMVNNDVGAVSGVVLVQPRVLVAAGDPGDDGSKPFEI